MFSSKKESVAITIVTNQQRTFGGIQSEPERGKSRYKKIGVNPSMSEHSTSVLFPPTFCRAVLVTISQSAYLRDSQQGPRERKGAWSQPAIWSHDAITSWGSRALALGNSGWRSLRASQIRPVNIWADSLDTNLSPALALKSDCRGFRDPLFGGDGLSEIPDRGAATAGKVVLRGPI